MAISHPSMKRATTNKNIGPNKQEVYVVDNASGDSQEPQDDILNANEKAAEVKKVEQTISKNKKSLLEDLLFLGRAKKEVEIGEIKFEICTLTQDESASLMREVYASKDGADLFLVRSLTLAYALRTINGIDFDEIPLGSFEEEAQFETALDKKMAILGQMQKNIIEKLHEEYIELVDNSEKAVKGGDKDIKN